MRSASEREAGWYFRVAYASSMVALAVVLHLLKVPFPPAPFLKYDLSGVPLAVLALTSLRDAAAFLPAFFLGVLALGADVVGASMKALAELSTFAPLALSYGALAKRFGKPSAAAASAAAAALSRVAAMCLANYFVAPYWLVWAGWVKSFEEALAAAKAIMPAVAVFNASLAAVVAPLALGAYSVLERVGLARRS